ncbi:hypothetical protein EVAR_14652_1 [Eumeta japonica]|uniref:Uncharacterized protein n=1 Tax=Eumeta variegata TaxID=151549 RepID=A0A4C1U210_EUMVA|nr:hypothetical protein EVAR_14652_1 [Eumeta japonica]
MSAGEPPRETATADLVPVIGFLRCGFSPRERDIVADVRRRAVPTNLIAIASCRSNSGCVECNTERHASVKRDVMSMLRRMSEQTGGFPRVVHRI